VRDEESDTSLIVAPLVTSNGCAYYCWIDGS